jgi:predicted nucleotidyltransferase
MIDLSSSTDPRIAVASQVLAEIEAVAARHGFPLMVVGATARDILSEAIVGAPPARATADVDVAVAVPSWEAFEVLTDDLTRVGRSRHRFLVSGVQLDVVPFGDVETTGRLIDWGDGTRMSALGLSEAYARAERVRLPGGTEVLVPTVAGLAVLKLSAWSDRRLETRRDAVDLQTIIGWYATGTSTWACSRRTTSIPPSHRHTGWEGTWPSSSVEVRARWPRSSTTRTSEGSWLTCPHPSQAKRPPSERSAGLRPTKSAWG